MRNPMQPIVIDESGAARFKENKIVRWLFSSGKLSLSDIAVMPFDDDDRMQIAQLIGYSLTGYGGLSYVSRESIDEAEEEKHRVLARQEALKFIKGEDVGGR